MYVKGLFATAIAVFVSITIFSTAHAVPIGNKVAVYGPTAISNFSTTYNAHLTSLGVTVDIISGAVWDTMTTADFAEYRALIVPDANRSARSTYLTQLENSRTDWSPAVNGNMIIVGTDEASHGTTRSPFIIEPGLDFVLSDPTKTGMYISMSEFYETYSSPTSAPSPTSSSDLNIDLLDQFGTFGAQGATVGACADDVHIVDTSVLSGTTDAQLSNWGCSIHEYFTTFDSSFEAVAISENVAGVNPFEQTYPDGSTGLAYIIARTVVADPIPEPASMILFGSGLLGLAAYRRFKKNT